MTGVDTNVLVDLLVRTMPEHAASVRAVGALGDSLWATPTNIGECLRLLTHPRVFPKPLKLGRAATVLEGALEKYSIRVLDEAPDWWTGLPELEREVPGLRGNEVFDARIALCLRAHGVKAILTRDAGFRRFPFLKTLSPA